MAAVGKAATASKAVVKISQMTPEYLENTIKFTQEAMDENHSMQEIAMAIKQSLQNFYQGTWHVMVGRKFGCYCTHEQGKFAYFYIGQLGVCVFQTV